ncbi:hypothetical protein PTTG_07509 [Puccinia triticina 1-1 BBBD Race 1]|uniref:Smg4_UPF3 domain-containing protein n=2 Tax=Puccinia triticina TaxID=208348 RepID=A0A180GBH2_PUCT1|nr:uncharacterized protein PtA15_13A9 [Puccinia triticina]OAV89981.1 hypothetical protein PTTG_07509 [Puccinia triticina 1-1 BBBD Race 1]WAQ90611.1 hypothetical protein PtA15_13A9 [Puccinia triticina]WAR60765.1 hypothetical protein PtB15_13B9 [Puccinia triticina]
MTERTKLVVRHLPPSLPEEVFWKTVSRWLEPTPREDGTIDPPKCTATFKSYVPGKVRRNKTKVEIPSRAYIQFATPDQVVEFHQGYANQAFRDSHGNLTFPKVEFAPYQKVAGPPKKIDNRIGTIDTDHEYQAFLEGLNATGAPEPSTSANNPDPAVEKVERPEITPLIEHLRTARKAAQEAAATAKQQRNAANSSKSTSGRPFAAPPQIMKRETANSGNKTAADLPSRKSDNPAPHDTPPHMSNSAPPPSKGAKQTGKSSSTVPPPTTQAASAGPNAKSRPNKPPKSKRAGRGAEDQSTHSPATEAQGKSLAPTQPKMILQPPKPSESKAEKPSATSTSKNPSQSPSKAGNSSGKKQGSSLAEQAPSAQNGQAKTPNSAREGSGGSKKPARGGGAAGRGGKGKKASSAAGNPTSQPTEPSAPPPSSSATPATQKGKNHEPAKTEPSSSETAAARRRLGNALAGITSKPDRAPRKKQNSKPAPSSSSNPPPAE